MQYIKITIISDIIDLQKYIMRFVRDKSGMMKHFQRFVDGAVGCTYWIVGETLFVAPNTFPTEWKNKKCSKPPTS